jgi:hypothetical protein
MATWNYRLIRYDAGTQDECVGIFEVYYDDIGFARMYSSKPCGILANSVDDLYRVLDKVKEAFDKPVLDAKDLPGYVEK